ncbi:MAG: hypothetical protein IJJ33_04405 [Victivallales bacterium]|nr:hypothetical protein [Victivallales bacterium]
MSALPEPMVPNDRPGLLAWLRRLWAALATLLSRLDDLERRIKKMEDN